MHLVLTKADAEWIQDALTELQKKTRARLVMLVDQSGRSLAHASSAEKFDVDALAALIAGSFASTRALAGLIGETEFFSLFHEGENRRIHYIVVDNDRLLAVIFDQKTTAGRIRLGAENTAERLAARFRDIAHRKADLPMPLAEEADKRLDQLYEP